MNKKMRIQFLSRSLILAFSFVGFAGISTAGDRMGNGGDLRRFRTAWAVRYLKETFRHGSALRSNPKAYPAGCSRALEIYTQNESLFQATSKFSGASSYEWNADPNLPKCLSTYSNVPRGNRFVFSYSKCSQNLARAQIVYILLDEMAAVLRSPSDLAERVVAFGNALRAPNCLSVSPDTVSGDRLFFLGEFDDPKRVLIRFETIRKRLIGLYPKWTRMSGSPAPGPTWEKLMRDAGLDPLRISQGLVLEEIRRWQLLPAVRLTQCAETAPRPFAPIAISPPYCGRVGDEDEFQWLLLHETAHHFGYEDEASADRFAQAFSDLELTANPIIRRR